VAEWAAEAEGAIIRRSLRGGRHADDVDDDEVVGFNDVTGPDGAALGREDAGGGKELVLAEKAEDAIAALRGWGA
jgi:hypothetical protein